MAKTMKTTHKATAGKRAKKAGPRLERKLERKLVRATAPLRKAFEKARALIAKLRGQGTVAYDELWEEVDRVVSADPPLYIGGGYRSLKEFIEKELPGETMRSVARNTLVARSFTPEDEARHGIAFLEEMALYAKELVAASEVPRAIDLDRLKVAIRSGEAIRRIAARVATVDQVRKARRVLRAGGHTTKAGSPAEIALRAAIGKRKPLAQVAVRASARDASFSGVPLAALADFGRALVSVKLPG